MMLDALLKGSAASGGAADNAEMMANLLTDKETQAKIQRYQDFTEKKLSP